MTTGTKKPSMAVRFYYGIGSVAYGVKANGFNFLLLIFYSQALGLSASLTGLALGLAVFFDAISDPIVGYVSDNWRSKWGRRHPFMYVSMLPICFTYMFLWNPPEAVLASQQSLFFYLLGMAIFIRILITFFEVPNTALISELTDDYDLRTGLMGARYMFGWIGGTGIAFLGYAVFLANGGGVLEPAGYVNYGIAAAVLMFVSMLVSSLGTHRAIKDLHVPPPRTRVGVVAIFKDLRETASNRSFLVLLVASIFSSTSAGLMAALSIYFSTFYWGLSSGQISIFSIVQVIAALLALPLAYMLGKKFEKKPAAIAIGFLMIVTGPALLLARLGDLLPANGSDVLFAMLLVHNFIEVLFIIMFFTLFAAMLADVVEDSAVDTARRSEGVLFAARGFADKMVSGLGVFMAGAIISAANFVPRNTTPENVPPEVLRDLVLYTVPTQVVLYIIALVIISRYGITRAKHKANVASLAS